ncbi:MAG: hypothetical protein HC778_03375 [Chamaesiphon sp. CSU_1_12]|nr:hypothetical protein [Chamaesiphon sp. CSU_1_12]
MNENNQASPLDTGTAQSILQMDFKSRVVPLFQFLAFSDRDLEIAPNIDAQFDLTGRIHSNGNLYLQSYNSGGIRINGKITVAEDIYNRIDAGCILPMGTCLPVGSISILYAPSLYANFPPYGGTAPLNAAALSPFLGNVRSKVKAPTVPDLTMLRKRNYSKDTVGQYFGKADLRIGMFPDRQIPFEVTTIQTSVAGYSGVVSGACTTTFTSGQDPASNYISADRQGTSPVCSNLNVGQLISLTQPILVVARGSADEEAAFCLPLPGTTNRVRDLIAYTSYSVASVMAGLSTVQQDKVLHALRVAIAASSAPLDYAAVINAGVLPVGVKAVFSNLLQDATLGIGLSPLQLAQVLAAPPASLAKARRGCFLPAPIAMVKNSSGTTGVFDRRRNRLMTVLQTNIESLTLWNRDGWYVNMGSDPTIVPVATMPAAVTSLNTPSFSTDKLLFIRINPDVSAASNSFVRLGLGAVDRTDGGLVLHATVNDNLSGDGSISAATNAVATASDPIFKLKPDRTPVLDSAGDPIILDYYRRYKGGAIRQSPYGFAFTGGATLPAPLTIATDGAAYLQGDWNILSGGWQSASLLADDITALSNNCLSPGTTTDPNQVMTAQINCAIPATTTGIVPWTGNAVGDYTASIIGSSIDSLGRAYNAATTRYNLATLVGKQDSLGNLGTNRGSAGGGSNGSLSNYFGLLEVWPSSSILHYQGSMLQLGMPLESNLVFARGGIPTSYYYPPNLNLRYETNFDTFL